MEELRPPTTLSHYRIHAKIGAGGMGEIYLAEDTELERLSRGWKRTFNLVMQRCPVFYICRFLTPCATNRDSRIWPAA